MPILRGVAPSLGVFLAGFVLHIVGGANDWPSVFETAVIIIVTSAVGFPLLSLFFAGSGGTYVERRSTLVAGTAVGYILTLATLWAINDRAFAAWQFPGAAILVGAAAALALLPLPHPLPRLAPRTR